MYTDPRIPAAQYLRMSTDRQEYSIDNQGVVIQQYAEAHGFSIVQTYEDAGKSGLTISDRTGLKTLLSDVLKGKASYRAVLVYDVSRWGRFQDADEAAHYEFLCKSSGIRVHYCAEQFGSEDTLPSRIMKALKRTMAAEFSRELGERVYIGKKRLAEMGFHEGRPAGYGLRRVLVSAEGKRKQRLRQGEFKSLTTDRVLLEPGPVYEQKWVRWIYEQFIRGLDMTDIAKELNLRNVPWLDGKRWNRYGVRQILTNGKYAGQNVWGVWSQRLRTKYQRNPRDQWIVKLGAFRGVVDQRTFDRAQRVIASKTYRKSNDALLRDLKRLWKKRGTLSESVIDRTPGIASCEGLRHRFGSMAKVYELIGFRPAPVHSLRTEKSKVMIRLRVEVLQEVEQLFPNDARLMRGNTRQRYVVEFPRVGRMGIALCRSYFKPDGFRYWLLYVRSTDSSLPMLVCLMNRENDAIEAFYVMPVIEAKTRMTLTPKDPWFRRGLRLESLADLRSALQEVQTWVPLGSIYRGFSNLTTLLMGPARTHIHDNERREAAEQAGKAAKEVSSPRRSLG